MYLSLFSILSNKVIAQTPSDPCLPNQQTLFIRNQAFLAGAIAIGDFPGSTIKKASDLINSPLVPHTGNNFTNNFKITGNFQVDKSINFNGCRVFMAVNSAIGTTSTSATFTSNGAKFMSEGMWKGIVGKVGNIVLDTDTEIEDAIVGLTLSPFSKGSSIQGTIFNRNQIGIAINFSTGSNTMVFKKPLSGNTFNCTSALNILGVNDYKWSISGICINKVNVPKLSSSGNQFKGVLRTGIEIYGSATNKANVTIEGCQFLEISFKNFKNFMHPLVPSASANGAGYGIYAENATLNVKGLGVAKALNIAYANEYGRTINSEPTFRNCEQGAIRTFQSNLSVNNCNFIFRTTSTSTSDCRTSNMIGIVNSRGIIAALENIKGEKVDVNGNHFDLFFNGSGFVLSPTWNGIVRIDGGAGANNINSNTFDYKNTVAVTNPQSNPGMAMILVNESSNKKSLIETNRMDVEDGHWSESVFVYNTSNIAIARNNISGFTDGFGILVNNCNNINILDNKIKGKSSSSRIRTGVGIYGYDKAQNNLVKCNTADICDEGFLFDGDCEFSQFQGNIMSDCKFRLILEDDATGKRPVIGRQVKGTNGAFQNQFMNANNSLTYDAFNAGDGQYSAFFTLTDNYTQKPQKVSCPLCKTSWFTKDNSYEEVNCVELLANTNDADLSILEDDVVNLRFTGTPVAVWQEESKVMYKLATNPNLMNAHSDRETFFNQKTNTQLVAYASVKDRITKLFSISEADLTQIKDWELQKYNKLMQLVAIVEEANALFGEEEWSVAYQQNYDNYTFEIEGYDAQIANQLNTIIAERMSLANTLNAENNQLIANSVFEFANKTINSLALKKIMTDEWSQEEINTIQFIANQCVSEYGDVLSRAHFLLENNLTRNSLNNNCSGSTIPNSGKIKQSVTSSIYPNPANDNINITIENAQKIRLLSVRNVTGMEIERKVVDNNNSLSFDLSSYQNGIYFIHFMRNDGSSFSEKFIVNH